MAGQPPRRPITHALFDFDGTLSMLRAGWASVMLQQFLGTVPRLPGETEDAATATFRADIARTTGAPTIRQMQLLAERVTERGGIARDAREYKHEYSRRLAAIVAERIAAVRSGVAAPDAWLVPGSRALLDALTARSVQVIIASGTDENAVRLEVALLGLADYFGEHIYGARDREPEFDKGVVIGRLLASAWIDGAQLAVFGDGPVEIKEAKAVGALAVGVATDETGDSRGRIDPEKAHGLSVAGADVIVPDYQCLDVVLAALFGSR